MTTSASRSEMDARLQIGRALGELHKRPVRK